MIYSNSLLLAFFHDDFILHFCRRFFLESSFWLLWLDENQIRHPTARLTNWLTTIQNASMHLFRVCLCMCVLATEKIAVYITERRYSKFSLAVAVDKRTMPSSVCICICNKNVCECEWVRVCVCFVFLLPKFNSTVWQRNGIPWRILPVYLYVIQRT